MLFITTVIDRAGYMTIDERIHLFRSLGEMTQKYLGTALGFPEKSADVRLAQYETGSGTPKAELTATLARGYWMFRPMPSPYRT